MFDLMGYSKLDLSAEGLPDFDVYYRDVNGGKALIFKGAPTVLIILDEKNALDKVSYSFQPRPGRVLHHCEYLKGDYCYVQVVSEFVHKAIWHVGGRHQYADRFEPSMDVMTFKSVLDELQTNAAECTPYLQKRFRDHPLSLIFRVPF